MTSLETQPPRLEETDAVRELLNRLYAAWADNDAEAVADRYRDDATVVPAGIGRTVVFQDPRVFAAFGLAPRLRHAA